MLLMAHSSISRPAVSQAILRHGEVRSTNAAAVFRLLLADGRSPRSHIARELGLSQGAVTRIVAELESAGLVAESERLPNTKRGRPRVPVRVVPESRMIIGLHVGFHLVHAALTDLHGRPLHSRRSEHDGSVEDVLDKCAEHIAYLSTQATSPLLGIGVITGGRVDPGAGIVRRHDVLDWDDVSLGAMLAERTRSEVLVETSARAHSLADMLYGKARGHQNFAHIFVGHVVEAALVLDGRVHVGPSGLGGSLERWVMDDGTGRALTARDLVGDGAVIARAQRSGILPPNAVFEDVVDLSQSGTTGAEQATALLHARARDVGTLTAALTDLVDISLVIFSSGVVTLDSSVEHIRAGLLGARRGLPVPEIRIEANSGETLTRAAAAVVLESTLGAVHFR